MDSQKGHHMPGQLPPIRIQLTTDICCQICCQNCYFFSKGNCVLFRPHGSPWCYFLLLPFASICFRWVQGSSWDSQAHVGRRGTSPMEPRTKLWMIWMCQTVYICLYNFIIFYRCYIMLYHVIQLCSIWSFELGEASCEAMLFITMWLFLRCEAAEWSQQISVFGLNHVEPFLHVLTCVLRMALHNEVFRMFDCKNFRKSDWSLALNFFRQLPLQEARRSV